MLFSALHLQGQQPPPRASPKSRPQCHLEPRLTQGLGGRLSKGKSSTGGHCFCRTKRRKKEIKENHRSRRLPHKGLKQGRPLGCHHVPGSLYGLRSAGTPCPTSSLHEALSAQIMGMQDHPVCFFLNSLGHAQLSGGDLPAPGAGAENSFSSLSILRTGVSGFHLVAGSDLLPVLFPCPSASPCHQGTLVFPQH